MLHALSYNFIHEKLEVSSSVLPQREGDVKKKFGEILARI
jgi:hypothetical protein